MIIDFNISFNTYKEKILNKYDFFNYKCPKCGAKHSFIRHATYNRNISFLDNNTIVHNIIKILRLKCTSCKSTHAILPNDLIPYCIYSYSFIIKISLEYFIHQKNVLSIAHNYDISFQLIYYFISKLNLFFKSCIYVLRLLDLLKDIFNPSFNDLLISINLLPNFLIKYLIETKWMFLMSKFHNIFPKPISIGYCKC